MQYVTDELFHFLEKSPYFYKKEKFLNDRGSEDYIFSQNSEKNVEQLNYTFFDQYNCDHIIAEISIPVKNPHEEIKWKYIQLNDKVSKPSYQSVNPSLEIMPDWFKALVLEVKSLYENRVLLFRYFAPINKN